MKPTYNYTIQGMVSGRLSSGQSFYVSSLDLDPLGDNMSLLPEGVYTATVAICEPFTAKSGKPALRVRFDTDGGFIWSYYSLQPQALWALRAFLKACDIPSTDLGFETNDVIGKIVDVIVAHEVYNNVLRAKVFAVLKNKEAQGLRLDDAIPDANEAQITALRSAFTGIDEASLNALMKVLG